MAKIVKTLIDVVRDQYCGDLSIVPDDVGGTRLGYKVTKRRLGGGLRDAVDVIEVDNGMLKFIVLPQRGMGIWKAWLGGIELGWKSPIKGPVHPHFVPVYDPAGLGWLAGFDELLCRCGLESNGAPEFDERGVLKYPLHGKIANLPAHWVEVAIDGDSGEISIAGAVDESRLHFQKLRLTSTITTKVGEAGLLIHDEVSNLSESPGEFQMLYHINFGAPLLEAGAKVVVPVKMLVPRNERAAEGVQHWDSYPAAEAGFKEQVYFVEPACGQDGETQALLKNASGTRGISMSFNTRQLPCFTVWKNTASVADGYVTGLEPGTNFPNPRSYEKAQQRVVVLEPGESRSFDVRIEVHTDAAQVERVEMAIAKLQSGSEPRFCDQPQPGWCADYGI